MSDKTSNYSKRTIRQLEILKKYHEVDEEKKTIKVCLHYEKASDILLPDLGDEKVPAFGTDIIERINNILITFPIDYKLDLDLKIDDYEGYDPQVLLNSLLDILELENYRTFRQNRKTWLLAMILLFIGAGLLILLNVLKDTEILQDTLQDRILDYFIDTCACVFMWECVSQLFLYPAEFVVTNMKVFRAVNSIGFINNKNKLLAHVDAEEMKVHWVKDTGKQKTGKIFLMLTGSLHVILGAVGLANFFVELSRVDFSASQIVANGITICIVSGLQILYGIGAINRFRETGPFRGFVHVLSYILFATYFVEIGLIIWAATLGTTISGAMIVNIIVGALATTLTLIGCIFTSEKKNKK